MGPCLITRKIIHVIKVILKWISKIIPYKKNLQWAVTIQIHFLYICFWIDNLIGVYKVQCPLRFYPFHLRINLVKLEYMHDVTR
jgi:hypothetical protein